MKVLLVFLSSIFALGSTYHLSYVLPPGQKWFVPNFMKGASEWVERSRVLAELAMLEKGNDLVKYYLWTKDNPKKAQLLVSGNSTSVHQSKFNKANPTRIIAHGFQASHKSEVCTMLRDAYMKNGVHNVICVDWSPIANTSYPTARAAVPSVGYDLANFIQFLSESTGMSIKEKLIVVGHSLGTHVVGFAGKSLKQSKNTLPVIVVCDPPHQLFSYEDCSSRICNTDADFVESIQTSAGKIGFFRPIGDGTYYPNGGQEQPGCGVDANGHCAHLRSYKYFAEAFVKENFRTKRCYGYNQCEDKFSNVKMGTTESFSEKGKFYVPVNSKSPYGTGSDSIFGR